MGRNKTAALEHLADRPATAAAFLRPLQEVADAPGLEDGALGLDAYRQRTASLTADQSVM
jgi:hypothetical protein